MTKTPTKTWPELAIEGWVLGAEMSAVIWLRTLRMMTGGRLATREAERMVSEKIAAAMSVGPAIMAGGVMMVLATKRYPPTRAGLGEAKRARNPLGALTPSPGKVAKPV